MIKCPNCGAQIADDSRFCSECGKEITQANVCPHCGASVGESDAFCQNCGKSLNESRSSEPITYEEEQPKSGFKKYLPYIIGGILLLGIIGYFNSKGSNGGSSTNTIAVDSVSIDSTDSPSTKEIITKRLEDIFEDVAKGNAKDCDERYFSSDFKKIYKEVIDIDELFAQEGSLGFWDFTFWEMTQGDGIMSVDIKDVYDIKDKEATAKLSFKYSYDNASSEYKNEDIKVVLENGKWVLDDLHGYKKQMKAFVEENKDYQPSNTQNKIDSSSGNDYSSNSSNTSSSSRTFYSEQIVIGYLANQTFRSSDGLTMRVDGSGRLYVDGDYAGVLSVLRYNSTSALLRYGGGMYGEGKLTVQIVGDKFTLTDPSDGTVYYQR